MASCTVHRDGGIATWRHQGVYVPERYSVYTFGGGESPKEGKVVVKLLNTENYQWGEISETRGRNGGDNTPSSRYGYTAVRYQRKIYLWGGEEEFDKHSDNKLWCFDPSNDEWSCLTVHGDVPEARSYHSACIINENMIVFGGVSGARQMKNKLIMLNLNTHKWESKPQPQAHVCTGHTACAIKGLMYVIGGWNQTYKTQEEFVRVYDVRRDKWYTPSVSGNIPEPRNDHSAVTLEGTIFMFGGYTKSGARNDLYSFHTDQNHWSHITIACAVPPLLYSHQCVAVGRHIVIFGGKCPGWAQNRDLTVLSIGLHQSETELLIKQTSGKKQAEATGPPMSSKGATAGEQMSKLTLQERNVVKCTTTFYEQHCKDSYPMHGSPKGLVLVINMTEVKQKKNGRVLARPGSEKDRRCITALFKDLGFIVEIYEDVNIKQLNSAMKRFVKQATDMKARSIFVVLMSHGGLDRRGSPYIMMSEGDKVTVREKIEEYFSSIAASRLALIPKVVIVQACQGEEVDEGVLVEFPSGVQKDSASLALDTFTRVAEFCNYYFGFATQPKRPAIRGPDIGSWYISEINEVFREKAATRHMAELMAEVLKNVSRKYGRAEGIIQTTEDIIGLEHAFYLYPGID